MRIRAAFFAVTLLAAVNLCGETAWLPFDDALARATAEAKPIVLQVRGCGGCRELDELLKDADQRPAITSNYAAFVLARLEPADQSEAAQRLRVDVKASSIAVLTPRGEYVTSLKRLTAEELAALVVDVRDEAEGMARVDRFRLQHDDLRADLSLSAVMTRFRDFIGARKIAQRARDRAKSHGDAAAAEYAQITSMLPDYFLRRDPTSRAMLRLQLERFAKSAKTPENAALAYDELASFALNEGNPGDAIKAYRKCYEVAPESSPLKAMAKQQLIDRGAMLPDAAPTAATLRIISPQRATLGGVVQFSTQASPKVQRVAWFVDGVAVASTIREPYTAALNLGDVPRVHTVRAVGYDRDGAAIAEATTTVNDRLDAFRVSIVSPAAQRASGKVMFEADVAVPVGRQVKSVELFRNETKVAALSAPPFRSAVDLPTEFAYLRAVATLDDGQTAEETRLVNADAVNGEVVDVHAVSFAATINDRKGKRIDGLSGDEVVIRDSGVPVKFSFRDAKDEQATIGVAIDSSESMRESLLSLVEDVGKFVDVVASKQENVFLMTFDEHPHLIHPATGDAAELRDSLKVLRPGGTTAVYDAITFALQQFTGLAGKKALVVFTDGVDVLSSESVSSCVRMAQESGVPVYVIIPRSKIGPRKNNTELEKIASVTGGMYINGPSDKEAEQLFTRIRDDVRGQYLITFVSPAKTAGTWRPLKVEVRGREAEVRTVGGYYAR